MSRNIFLVALVGCTSFFEPSESFDPPKVYHQWHQQVEACTQIRRPFDDITWRVIYARAFPCGDMARAAGCFVHPKTIYLVEAGLDLEWLVKAELIHYVRHDIAHDELFYQCGGR